MQAEFNLSPLFRGAPTPPREACPDPDELADGDERRRRTRQVDAQRQIPDRIVLVSRQPAEFASRVWSIPAIHAGAPPVARDEKLSIRNAESFGIRHSGTWRGLTADAKALTLRRYPGTADMERFSARNDPSRLTQSGLS